MSTLVTVGVIVPGVAQQVHDEEAVAAGWPPINTVVLPLMIVPTCMTGTMYGSAGKSPTCGGVLKPVQPTTAAALPAISTVGQTPTVTGALNGSGGDGCGTPVAGLGMMWIGHVPMI
jgi:hypothetical protein